MRKYIENKIKKIKRPKITKLKKKNEKLNATCSWLFTNKLRKIKNKYVKIDQEILITGTLPNISKSK
jgi:hypothetical protein